MADGSDRPARRRRRQAPLPAPGASEHDPDAPTAGLPPGVGFDLGATAKALAADRAAARILPGRRRRCAGRASAGTSRSPAAAGRRLADRHRRRPPRRAGPSDGRRSAPVGWPPRRPVARRWRTAHRVGAPHRGSPHRRESGPGVAHGVRRRRPVASTPTRRPPRRSCSVAAAPEWLVDQALPALLIDVDGAVSRPRRLAGGGVGQRDDRWGRGGACGRR